MPRSKRKRKSKKKPTGPKRFGPAPYEPTAEEIRQRSAEVRENWSEKEHRKRAGVNYKPYEVPVLEFPPELDSTYDEPKELI